MDRPFLCASVAVQAVAAALWIWSTRAKVKAAQVVDEYQRIHGSGMSPALITDEGGNEVNATAARQSEISGWAAIATGVGVALQGISSATGL
jgi:hypothetical protein